MATLEKMTRSELQQLIEEIVDKRLSSFVKHDQQETDSKPGWDEARNFIEAHRLKPVPGSKSPLEMLREDRDR